MTTPQEDGNATIEQLTGSIKIIDLGWTAIRTGAPQGDVELKVELTSIMYGADWKLRGLENVFKPDVEAAMKVIRARDEQREKEMRVDELNSLITRTPGGGYVLNMKARSGLLHRIAALSQSQPPKQ